MSAHLFVLIAPSPLDRQRLIASAIRRWQDRGWPVRSITQPPEPELFAQDEILVLHELDPWPTPDPFLAESHGVLIAAATRLSESSPWRKGEVVDLSSEKPWERESRLARMLVESASAAEKKLPLDVATLIIQRLGSDHPAIDQELEKLFLFVGDRHHLHEQDVETVIPVTLNESGWLLGESVLQGQIGMALQRAHRLIERQDNPLPTILAQLRYVLEQALGILQIPRDEFQRIYPYLRPKRQDFLAAQARRCGVSVLENWVRMILETEGACRHSGGVAEQNWSLQCLLLKMAIR